MLFSELYSSALDHELGTDDSTRLFLTARRQRAINRGHFEFCDLTECAIRQSTITCSNGVSEYNLLSTVNVRSGDFLRVAKQGIEYHLLSSGTTKSTVIVAGDDLPRREIPWLNQYDLGWRRSTGGTPSAYYERRDGGSYFLGLVPPTRIGSSETAQVILPYVAKPSSMTADTNTPFTFSSVVREDLEPYHQALVHYAAAQLEKLRRDAEASQYQMQQFVGYIERYTRTQEPIGGWQVRMGRNYFNETRTRGDGDRGRTDYLKNFT